MGLLLELGLCLRVVGWCVWGFVVGCGCEVVCGWFPLSGACLWSLSHVLPNYCHIAPGDVVGVIITLNTLISPFGNSLVGCLMWVSVVFSLGF